MIIVQISERAFGQVKRGSLWIFANEFITKMKDLLPGTWAEFVCKSEFVGVGYVNPRSLIAGRICSREKVVNRKALFSSLVAKAFERRSEFRGSGSYRLLFSESDNTPGLIVDLYETAKSCILVAQSTTAGIDQAIDDWSESLLEVINPEALVIRGDSSIRYLEGVTPIRRIDRGNEEALRDSVVREDDILFAADFIEGQKTGFFLDQRENRKHLKKKARGKTVLDLCSYSGGWGLSALKGGASHVTFVDQSAGALELVNKGLRLNQFTLAQARLVQSDVFDFFEKENEKFDIVVCDPPAFVKSKKNLPQAIKAYSKLNSMALRRLKTDGVLYTCSCSFHLSEEEFLKILTECLQKEKLCGIVVYRGTQGLDHPWVLNRPESKYLKCFAIQKRLN